MRFVTLSRRQGSRSSTWKRNAEKKMAVWGGKEQDLFVSVRQMGPETAWFQFPLQLSKTLSLTKHSEVSPKQDHFVQGNPQAKQLRFPYRDPTISQNNTLDHSN